MTSTATAERPAPSPAPTSTGRRAAIVAIAIVAVLLAGFVVRNVAFAGQAKKIDHRMPQSSAMEQRLGVRFSRVAVVADGGLVNVSYVVLDSEKAQRFQADAAHPPILHSESREGMANRVSLMKQGHVLRTGQQYYFVYQNPKNLIRSEERVDITFGKLVLRHVPVW